MDTLQHSQKRPTYGAKIVALDAKQIFVRYYFSIQLSILGSAAFALMLHMILSH